MSGPNQIAVLAYMQANPDGVTIPQLRRAIGRGTRCVTRALNAIPHKYIDRWDGDTPIYCLANVPPDMPHPCAAE